MAGLDLDCVSDSLLAYALRRGGTGGIWKGVAKLLPPARMHFGGGNAVKAVDADAKTVTLASGATVAYESLVSTMPLDILLRMLGKPEWADGLTHSSSHIIGVGIRGAPHARACAHVRLAGLTPRPLTPPGPSPHGKKCWLYFPEDNCPFYRCGSAARMHACLAWHVSVSLLR